MRDLPESIDRAALLACAPQATLAGWDLDGLRALGLDPDEITVDGLAIGESRVSVTRVLVDGAGRMVPNGHNGALTVTAEIQLTGLWPDAERGP